MSWWARSNFRQIEVRQSFTPENIATDGGFPLAAIGTDRRWVIDEILISIESTRTSGGPPVSQFLGARLWVYDNDPDLGGARIVAFPGLGVTVANIGAKSRSLRINDWNFRFDPGIRPYFEYTTIMSTVDVGHLIRAHLEKASARRVA